MEIKLQTIGIIASDMSKTLNFYRTLGITIPAELDNEFNAEVELSNGITLGFLALTAAQQADPNFVTPIVGQNMNLQFEVTNPEDVDHIYQNLLDAGHQSYAAPWDAFWGQRFARIQDPDGRIVNIYANL